ncbi:UDP-N-acetylmuramoyl-tripeptide--D-alanyl-D-alanine ligase [Paenarthrobacter nicotinovorans]|uniref:UDP-N-acetylmuramoyl-tripeptide--D-alanyl-D- alanine ligase n=1 Tax=Paenarthrobacter nicotinovorans TaxID=29320 RepID=UPI0024852901|nr:UDP-N-acetylmuramoyl-tripeptide--D-alanyl-D-alanine ligase [Paenarthrobacter nicotinovorans]MDI2019760.1 UDP-N-acetylmuramoyl-tripeptide--D-alanyl-D-alanine ligase [Paenarthrobacter nicotinovorans]
MIAFTAAEIADITRGRLTGDPGIVPSSVVTDSREATPGSLYVAKLGEHADGHDFVEPAFERGAILALAEREVADAKGNLYPTIVVDDAVLAMGSLAAEVVRRIRAEREQRGEQFTLVGITGSSGKTTTKDLMAGILSQAGPTVAPQGSYNGEVGVPLTVFAADTGTRFLVIEMGATGVGHIKYLADMVKPDIGAVLMVGSAHAGEFGGVENIARTKGELVEALGEQGIAVINLDDARVAAMRARTKAKVVGFTAEPGTSGEIEARNVVLDAEGYPAFDLVLPDGGPSVHVHSRLIGAHHVTNLLAAAAAAFAAGIPAPDIASSLSSQPAASRWRMERTERRDGVTLINDAFNANPESMRAALRTLAHLGQGRRTWAVLGAMLELGEESIHEHTAVGAEVVRLNISRLLVVGHGAWEVIASAVAGGHREDQCWFVETTEEAYSILQKELSPGDLVLFKSSKQAGLRHLGDQMASN